MKKQWYNDEDELQDRKQMRNWPAKKEFHDENDKRIAELEKQKKDKESKKNTNFTVGPKNPAGRLKMNESQLRGIISKIIKESLEEIINPFDDGMGGVDTAMAAEYPNKGVGDAWLKKAGMRRDRLQGGKPVPIQGQQQGQIRTNESQLRKMISKIIKESLQNAKPWPNDTGHAVGNFDTSEVKRWNNLYNKPYDNFGRDTEEFTTDLDDRKKYWEATVKDFKNALKSDPALKKDIADMIKSGEYDSFDDENLILDWADQHLWNRPNPNSEYWKFRKSIESQGMKDAKEFHDSVKDGYAKKNSTDELWYAHDTDDEKDFDRLSRPIKESQFRKMVSKIIKESLEEMTSNGGENA